jgi:hypothetical protein
MRLEHLHQRQRACETFRDLGEPGVDGAVRRRGWRVALHFAQDQFAIDEPRRHRRDVRRPVLDQAEIDGRAHVAQRDGLSADEREGPVENFGLSCRESREQNQPHQNAWPSEMCSTFDRSRPPPSSSRVLSFQPQSTRSGPIGDR